MRVVAQSLEEILGSLKPLKVKWQDETASRVIARLEKLPVKKVYAVSDIQQILDDHFDDGLLISRLFLALSKDEFSAALRAALGGSGAGITRYRKNKAKFLDALVNLGILDVMALNVDRIPKWSDVLVERLRSGRGSAISGQRRGRGVEDFAEAVVKRVFADNYGKRCTFTGARGKTAKCDFAIPSKAVPQIVIEAKGYAATGSKMTDVLGDIQKIIEAKRADTALLFFTDGLTWNQRKNDLRKIVAHQNAGDITRIYTSAMRDQFEADLRQLKSEYGL
jgi:hypothetical protein